MPHIRLEYTDDLILDARKIFAVVESVIERHDSGAGRCKAMAIPVAIYNVPHVNVDVYLLPKAHRDTAFSRTLLADLELAIRAAICEPCGVSLNLQYRGEFYVTCAHDGG